MPYTPPGIEVIQELDVSAVATSSPAQPVVVIGPAFQIVTDEAMGSYTGGSLVAAFGSAGVVDIREDDPLALASENLDVSLNLDNVVVETLSETTLGGDHVPTPLVLAAGATGTWAHLINATTLAWTVHAATDADALLLQVGDFISFDSTPNVWRVIDSIDTTARTITWTGGAWPVAVVAGDTMSAIRPAIPDSIEPGASAWEDQTNDLSALGVAVGDKLVVSEPTTFAGSIDVLSLQDGNVNGVNLDGSFVSAPRLSLGTATLTNASAAVAAGTADFTAIKTLVDAGQVLALFDSVSGAFIPISAVASASALTLATVWPAAAPSTPTVHVSFMGPSTPIGYSIQRDRPDLPLPRIDWDFLEVVLTATNVTIPAGLTSGGFPIVSAALQASYRALDETKATLKSYADLAALQADYVAGDNALIPANPLGFAAKMALANTSNPVWAIGYDESFYTSEATAFAEALALIEEQDVYTLVVCSMTGDALAPAMKTHVDDQSGELASVKTYFRIGAFCRRRITQEETVADTTTLSTAPEGVQAGGLTFTDVAHATGFVDDGVIAGQQLQITQAEGPQQSFDGWATPSTRTFTDENNLFAGAVIGDDLVIETGTDAGTYPITQVAAGVITVGATLTGDDVTGEVTEAAGQAIVAGVASPAALVEAPMVAETLVLAGDVDIVGADIGVAGPAAPAAVYTFSIPAPVKAATALTLVVNGATVDVNAAGVFTGVAGGTLTLNLGACSIDRDSGLVTIDKTDGVDQSGDDWVCTYTGFVSGTTDAAGVITGVGITAGTVNETTGALTLTTPYDDTIAGTIEWDVGGLTAAYRPRQTYHVVYKSAISPLITTDHTIASLTQDILTFAASILGTIVGPLRTVSYRVVKDMTLDEQATALAGIASSPSISSRRIVMVQPDTAVIPVANVDTNCPGWAFAAAVGALVDQLPSQQGLTRRGLTGFTSRVGGKDYFRTETRLNTIAGGGVMLFENDGVGQGIYIRHQLTTDISAILLQELSMTKNIDSVSSEMIEAIEGLIGGWNVQEGLFIVVKLRIGGLVEKFVNTRVARLGGKMKPGSKLLSVVESPTQPDTLLVTVDGRFPVPLNRIVLTLQASA